MNCSQLQIAIETSPLPRLRAQQIARLHIEQISDGFLTSLGPRFLVHLYDAIASSPAAFLITARVDDQLAGFICGATNIRQLYRHFAGRKALPAGLAALPRLLTPSRARHLWETWRYPSQNSQTELPASEVLNFCVASRFQRCGIGAQLFDRLTTEFRSRHSAGIKIVTAEHQESAHRFYEAIGALLAHRTEVHRGEASRVYVYNLSNLPVSDSVGPANTHAA